MSKPVLLDLHCKAGGAARGYMDAGFFTVGLDIEHQPRYVGDRFVQAEALESLGVLLRGGVIVDTEGRSWRLQDFAGIHASPPCQAYTALRTAWNAKEHIGSIGAVRVALHHTGLPYVIENVPGAPLQDYVVLCGTMFGLGVGTAELRRHRLFEMWPSAPLLIPPHGHRQRPITIGVYGQHGRDRRRKVQTFFSVKDGAAAMGIDWMTGDELSQAIPPAYTRLIGSQLMKVLKG